MSAPKAYLAPADVAALLSCSTDTVLRAIARGDLRAVKYGQRLVRISPAEVERFLARHSTDELAPRRRRRSA